MRLFRKIQNAFRWVSAVDCVSAEEYLAARSKLDSIDPFNLVIPNREFFLLKSYVLMKLNDKNAKPTLAEAMNAIDASEKINQDEREYLKKYAEHILASLYDSYNRRTVNCSGIDFSKVPKRTRDLFPLI